MKPSRRHRWIAWLLPVFILRAFVPMGFMWEATADGPRLVVCSGIAGSAASSASDPHAQHHVDHNGHDGHHAGNHEHTGGGDSESSHQGALCPFAAAGISSLDGLTQASLTLQPAAVAPIALPDVPLFDHGPISRHRIRGPPALLA
jgi:hypothetical protein